MKVIICGAGRVGYGIAERLAAEENDVSVIDTSEELVQVIRDTLDVRGYIGHGAHPDVLARAGAEQADMIIAVTLSDEVNMVACQVAHSLFNVPKKIARIRAQGYLHSHWSDLFSRENMPIDVIISPEVEVGWTVLRRIALPGAIDVTSFIDDKVVMTAIEYRCAISRQRASVNEVFPAPTGPPMPIRRGPCNLFMFEKSVFPEFHEGSKRGPLRRSRYECPRGLCPWPKWQLLGWSASNSR